MVRCDHCSKSLDGLPHRCKYCNEIHCSEHIQPESHDCPGLGKSKKFFNSKPKKNHYFKQPISYGPPVKHTTRKNYNEGYTEMYHPQKSSFHFPSFRDPFKNLFSFTLPSQIINVLAQFCIALFIGLGLNYVYYQNLSLHYLFMGGVQQWFATLQSIMNYGMSGGGEIFYLIINGIFYFYLFSTTVKFIYATITNINKKGTILFIIGIVILLFIIFKYFPNAVY